MSKGDLESAGEMGEDLILTHAREVSRLEILWVEGWFRAVAQGASDKARAIIRTGTDAEHYLALLAHDPAERTEAQSARLRFLIQELERALELVPVSGDPYP